MYHFNTVYKLLSSSNKCDSISFYISFLLRGEELKKSLISFSAWYIYLPRILRIQVIGGGGGGAAAAAAATATATAAATAAVAYTTTSSNITLFPKPITPHPLNKKIHRYLPISKSF